MPRSRTTRLAATAAVAVVLTVAIAVPTLWFLSLRSVTTTGDPAEDYLSAYMLNNHAASQAAAGDHLQASWTYLKAKHAFAAIHDHSPTWKPAVVAFRRKKVDEALVASLKATVGL